jgi:hypothetical protein
MKKYIIQHISILLLLSLFASAAFSQIKVVKLTGVTVESNGLPADLVAVFLKLETVQHPPGGLVFSLNLTNTSDKDVTIGNPLDFLQVALFDSLGNNISIPQPPKVLVDTRVDVNNETETFAVEKMTINNVVVGKDVLNADEIKLPPKGVLEITLQIQNVLVTQDGKIVSSTSRTPLNPGTYSLSITLSLVGEGIASEIFQADPIPVTYL